MGFQADLLKGKAALVTGGGSGICRGMALALAAHGCDVAVTGRRAEPLEAVRDEIDALGARGFAAAGDVRDPAAAETAVTSSVEAFGRLGVDIPGSALRARAVRFGAGGLPVRRFGCNPGVGVFHIGPILWRRAFDGDGAVIDKAVGKFGSPEQPFQFRSGLVHRLRRRRVRPRRLAGDEFGLVDQLQAGRLGEREQGLVQRHLRGGSGLCLWRFGRRVRA